jgi:hypothetical protein
VSALAEEQGPKSIGAMLAFVDEAGVTWRVTEHDGRNVPGSRGSRYLRFTSDYAVRRVWGYPAEWRTLEPSALAQVSWRR